MAKKTVKMIKKKEARTKDVSVQNAGNERSEEKAVLSNIPLNKYATHVLQSRWTVAQNMGFSMRSWASEIGLDSGTLSRLLSGKRGLTAVIANQVGPKLALTGIEKDLFYKSAAALSIETLGGNWRKENRSEQEKHSIVSMIEGDMMLEAKAFKGSQKSDEEKEFIKHSQTVLDRVVVKEYKGQTNVFVTTVVQGSELDENFAAAIGHWRRLWKGDLVVVPIKAHMKPLKEDEYPLDPKIHRLWNDNIYNRVELNKNLKVINLDLRPYLRNPLAGLAEVGAKDGVSYIFAHPQQELQTYPHGMNLYPRIHRTTGSATKSYYRNNKQGLIGDLNHVIGGVIVEIDGDRFYSFEVQADESGAFVHHGIKYHPDGRVTIAKCKGQIRGDEHGGPRVYGSPEADKAQKRFAKRHPPEKTLIHDLYDACTSSHHREHSMKDMLELPKGIETIEDEILATREHLKSIKDNLPEGSEVIVVDSNHNNHLHKYLTERRWVYDRKNFKFALRLAQYYFNDNKDPLKEVMDPQGEIARWLEIDEQVVIEGVTVSAHGDHGINGARGGIQHDLVAFGKSSAGHSHTMQRKRGSARVGTTSKLKMGYNKGPSSWSGGFEAIYEGGFRQLHFIVDGRYSIRDLKDNGFDGFFPKAVLDALARGFIEPEKKKEKTSSDKKEKFKTKGIFTKAKLTESRKTSTKEKAKPRKKISNKKKVTKRKRH